MQLQGRQQKILKFVRYCHLKHIGIGIFKFSHTTCFKNNHVICQKFLPCGTFKMNCKTPCSQYVKKVSVNCKRGKTPHNITSCLLNPDSD